MDKVLIICGPTATGKTKFALEMAKKFDGELISADSRQIHKGKNIISGKDLPPENTWVNTKPGYYDLGYTKIWLYDVVESGEEFSVALWHDLALQVIEDILSRGKLPIIVGGTGLYIKSLTHHLMDINIPRNDALRKELADKDVRFLWNYLHQIKPTYLNESDRKNPRRLIRAIEKAKVLKKTSPSLKVREGLRVSYLQIGLTASRDELYRRIDRRVDERITAGAAGEDLILSANPQFWKHQEQKIVRQQLTWFKKQPSINWYDITNKNWQGKAEKLIQKWYNTSDAA